LPSLEQLRVAGLASLGIWLVAGAAAAFNCLVEKSIDAKMKRTAWRPTAKGELSDWQTLVFSAALCALGSWLLWVTVNPLTMWLTFATFVGYAVIYTVILKPLTPQNIVIGGASGAMPPVLGWAALTGDVGPEALILFLIIFLWTPPHFWALALFMKDDYSRAGVPMLTVTHGRKSTRVHVLVYTVLLVPVAVGAAFTPIGGPVYLVISALLNAGFLYGAWRIWRRDEAVAEADGYRVEKQVFRFSLYYLFLHFGAFLLEAALRSFGLGGW
jgi:protoheme IX farnesyltransferase